jgi:hypothetical protein
MRREAAKPLPPNVRFRWHRPGLSSARTSEPRLETAVATWLLHRSVPAVAKAAKNPLGSDAADIVGIARSATLMTAAVGRGSAAANIRMHRRFVSPSAPCRTGRCSIIFATASGTRGCRPGTCRTGRSGSSSPISVTCRARREWPPRSLLRAIERRLSLPRPMLARPRARNAMRTSTRAGANREWRTWCAIRRGPEQ